MKIKKLINKIKYTAIIFNFLVICLFNISIAEIKAANLSDAWTKSNTVAKKAGYNETSNYEYIVSQIIFTILTLLGVIFLILMVYGGSIWMTAGGKEDRVKKAKDLIQAAIIGLIIVVSAYAISFFVVSKMTEGVLTNN